MPEFNSRLDPVAHSAFLAVQDSVHGRDPSDTFLLHQGRTWFPPCATPALWDRKEFPMLAHEHAPPGGIPALRSAISDHLRRHRGRTADPHDIVVTNGASHGVSSAMHSVLAEGDEILVLSPAWLFAVGLAHAAGAVPVEVPVFLALSADPDFDFLAELHAYRTARTRAIYFNSPNNPTGYSFTPEQHARLVEFARAHDLWIIADNAYENFDFTDHGFIDIGGLPGAAERTFSVYSFSKTYAMPGQRVGYVVTPPGAGARTTKWGLYSLYSVSTTSQYAAHLALRTPHEELEYRRSMANTAREFMEENLAITHTPVAGGLYTFLDLSNTRAGSERFLAECAEEGVTLSPGIAFGRNCAEYARICFTAVDPEALKVSVDRINRVHQRIR